MSSHFLLPKLYYGLKLNDKKQWINFTPNTQNKTNSPPLYQLEVELSRWTLKWSKKKKRKEKRSLIYSGFACFGYYTSLLAYFACDCVSVLSRWGHSIAVWARQAGNDEVIQQAGLRPWQLALRPVPVLTGAVVPCARCCDPNSTPALPLCCFFISLVLAQSAVELARPTAWIYSCCKALGPSHSFSVSLFVSICGQHTVTTVLTGKMDRFTYQTHSLTQLC